jgi:hypothetical protein
MHRKIASFSAVLQFLCNSHLLIRFLYMLILEHVISFLGHA